MCVHFFSYIYLFFIQMDEHINKIKQKMSDVQKKI